MGGAGWPPHIGQSVRVGTFGRVNDRGKAMNKAVLACACAAALVGSGSTVAAVGGSVDDRAITAQGRAVLIDVRANDAGITGLRGMKIRSRPAHGTASVVGGQIRYVPAAGFRGRDRFTYIVSGSSGTGTATVFVEVGDTLVLQGRVVDSPIANALVTASVGGHDFSAQANANGDYSVEIIALDSNMVSMDARGVGAQSFVRLVSTVGDFDRIAEEAGGDRVLTRQENNQVQVTNLSTAQTRLLTAANGGSPVLDDVQLAVARESIDNGQLLQQAAAIKLVVDGGYPLPEGTTDTLALISVPTTLSQFIAEVNADDPAALANAIQEVVEDPELRVPVDSASLVGSYALIGDFGPPDALNVRLVQGAQLTLAANGTGSYASFRPNPQPSVTWSFDGGVADITPTNPMIVEFFPFVQGVQVRALSRDLRYRMSKLFAGEGRDTLSLTTTSEITYPDNPELQGFTQTGTTTLVGVRDEGGIEPLTAAEIMGSRSLRVPASLTPLPPSTLGGGSEIFTFFANGTGQRADGAPTTWSIDALGRLQLTLNNGDNATFRRVKRDGLGGEGMLGDWVTNGNERSAAFAVSAVSNGFVFDQANAERSWRSGFVLGNATIQVQDDFAFVLDPAGIAFQRSNITVPMGWSFSNGAVDINAYRNGSNQPVHFCQVGVNGCRIAVTRRWRAIGRGGDRVYVMEEFFQDLDNNGTLDLSIRRTNYYDEVARPQLGGAGAPAVRTAAQARGSKR
jgi:hypothetical protein